MQNLALFAEILGAVAVVASLVYLGRQIHQTNAQSQAAARYSFLEAYGQMNLTVAQNKDLASVFRRGSQGLELDEDEAIQFFFLLGQFLNTWSVLFDLHAERHLPDSQWIAIRKDMIALLSTQGGQAFWRVVGRVGVHDDFEREVERLLSSDESSYEIE
tara:strand:+ start:812 stop:1288 length:477 start_codon:yes stop_codon:yes gene_type:complete